VMLTVCECTLMMMLVADDDAGGGRACEWSDSEKNYLQCSGDLHFLQSAQLPLHFPSTSPTLFPQEFQSVQFQSAPLSLCSHAVACSVCNVCLMWVMNVSLLRRR